MFRLNWLNRTKVNKMLFCCGIGLITASMISQSLSNYSYSSSSTVLAYKNLSGIKVELCYRVPDQIIRISFTFQYTLCIVIVSQLEVTRNCRTVAEMLLKYVFGKNLSKNINILAHVLLFREFFCEGLRFLKFRMYMFFARFVYFFPIF